MEYIYISNDQLDRYCQHLHEARSSGKAIEELHDFIATVPDDGEYVVSLEQLVITEGKVWDLSGAKLNGVDIGKDGLNGNNFIIMGYNNGNSIIRTDMRTTIIPEVCKVQNLKIHDVDLGPRKLTNEQYPGCNFERVTYNPTHNSTFEAEVTSEDIKAFAELTTEEKQKVSFADFILLYKYPYLQKTTKIVPKLSNIKINGTEIDLDGADFSGCIMDNVTFRNIKGEYLGMRDMDVGTVMFNDLNINTLDMRGSEDKSGEVLIERVMAQNPVAQIWLTDSPQYSNPAHGIVDFCYQRRTNNKPFIYHKCTLADLNEFIAASRADSRPPQEKQSFLNFLRTKYDNLQENSVPSLQELDLSGKNMSFCNWGRCDFSFCTMNDVSLEGSICDGSSFFSVQSKRGYVPNLFARYVWSPSIGLKCETTSLKNTIWDGCDIEGGNFRSADMTGISMRRGKIKSSDFTKSIATKSDWSDIKLDECVVDGMDASDSFFSKVTMDRLKANGAKLDYCNVEDLKLRNVIFSGGSISSSAIKSIELRKATVNLDLSASCIGAATFDGSVGCVETNNTSIGHIEGNKEIEQRGAPLPSIATDILVKRSNEIRQKKQKEYSIFDDLKNPEILGITGVGTIAGALALGMVFGAAMAAWPIALVAVAGCAALSFSLARDYVHETPDKERFTANFSKLMNKKTLAIAAAVTIVEYVVIAALIGGTIMALPYVAPLLVVGCAAASLYVAKKYMDHRDAKKAQSNDVTVRDKEEASPEKEKVVTWHKGREREEALAEQANGRSQSTAEHNKGSATEPTKSIAQQSAPGKFVQLVRRLARGISWTKRVQKSIEEVTKGVVPPTQ